MSENERCGDEQVVIGQKLIDRIRGVQLIAFDFDGVFTDNRVYVFEDGKEAVSCWRSDGIGLRKLDRMRIKYAIISTEPNPVVLHRSRKLGVECVHGCNDKRATLESMAAKMGITLEETCFVGNDINDLPCLTRVGLPIVVRDAHPDVVPCAIYRTKAPGGYGAVREVCDLFERVRMKRS